MTGAIIIAGISLLWGNCLESGQILSFIGDKLRKLPERYSKPLGLCPVCSGFWFGLIYCAFFAAGLAEAALWMAGSHVIIRLVLR